MVKILEKTSASRRKLLRDTLAVASVFGLGVSAAQAAKASKGSVAYRDSPNGDQNCANCRLFISPNACKSVEGAVSPNGWCKIWKA
jgi:hypothetical protein